MRKVEVGIKHHAAPDAPGFDSAVVGWQDIDEIRRLPILEQKRDVRLERRLIAFDREVVMRLTLHQIGRQFALRQQRIGGDVRHGHTPLSGYSLWPVAIGRKSRHPRYRRPQRIGAEQR